MTDFNFSVAAGALPQSGAPAPLLSFNGVRMLAGPSGSVVLHRTRGDRRIIVQPEVAEALRLCGPFRTLEAHARNIIEAQPLLREHGDHTRQTLQGLAEAGPFESSEACWERLTQPSAGLAAEPPCRVFILTCDRPAALNRLLIGLREYPLPNAVEGIWIIDDSRDADSLKENAAIIETQADGAKVPVIHVNLVAREDLVQQLKTTVPEYKDSVEWLLERSVWGSAPTYGIARNLALLLSVGKLALVLDDDIIPQAIAPPLSGRPLRFGSANDREAMFYASRETLAQHALPLPESPLAMMLASLGQPISYLLPRHFSDHTALSGIDGEWLANRGPASTVKLSQCGTWGDAGTGTSGNWIFHLPDASIKKLLASTTNLSAILEAGSNWFGYRGPTVTSYGIMAAVTGLDHGDLMPPYLPAGRGEDTLFGVMLQRLHPDSAVWNEAWAIRHEPIDERSRRGDLNPISATPSLALLTDWLGREPRDQWGITPRQRLMGMADQVQRLAVMDSDSLESLVRQELVSKRSALLNQCMTHLSRAGEISDLPGAPDWQAFLEHSRDQLVEEIQTPEANPLEERVSASALRSPSALRDHGQQFADTLRAWPQICEAAERFSA